MTETIPGEPQFLQVSRTYIHTKEYKRQKGHKNAHLFMDERACMHLFVCPEEEIINGSQ
jgi:hypothetical protein